MHPFECDDLVHQAVVPGRMVRGLARQLRKRKKAKWRPSRVTQFVDNDDAILPVTRSPQYKGIEYRPVDVSAAVNPDDYRQMLLLRIGRRPDVEVEAILTDCWRRLAWHGHTGLHARRSKRVSFARASPMCGRHRGTPTQIADRRGGERDSFVDTQAICAFRRYRAGLRQDLLREASNSQICRRC